MTDLDHVLLHEAELLGALEEARLCPDCSGGRGLHVDLTTGAVYPVSVHSVPCPRTSYRACALGDDGERNCPKCGKVREQLIGGIGDNPSVIDYCANCDGWPGEVWL